jgi:hypothetical protein
MDNIFSENYKNKIIRDIVKNLINLDAPKKLLIGVKRL